MAIDEFWANLRGAASWLVHLAKQDPAHADAATRERMLVDARMWLTPRSVEGFDPTDFAFLDEETQAALREGVERFRSVAERMPRRKPPVADRMPQRKLPGWELLEEGRAALGAIVNLLHPLEYVDGESFRTRILLERELRGKLPRWVTGISCRTGLDLVDEPAIWIQVDVTDAAVNKKLIAKYWPEIDDEIKEAYWRIGGRRYVFIHYDSPDAFAHRKEKTA